MSLFNDIKRALGLGAKRRRRRNPSSPYPRYYVGRTGDINALDYGGGVVYRDKYGYHMDWTPGVDDYDDSRYGKSGRGEKFMIYGLDLEPDMLAYHSWVDVAALNRQYDDASYDVAELGRSDDPMDRASAAMDIIAYYGIDELDSYPVEMTRSELVRARPYWAKALRP